MKDWQEITNYLYEKLKEHSANKIKIPNFNLEKLVFKREDPKIKKKKEKRGLYKAKHAEYKYEDFLKINTFHKEYIKEAVKNKINLKEFVSTMELTGAILETSECSGSFIVCEERKNVIYGIFPNNSIKMFPKENRIFRFRNESDIFYFIGNKIKFKRSSKK